ncbi:MAG: hypothetical protein ACMXYC_04375 [Candidatus Woesearchaeota archaeon]
MLGTMELLFFAVILVLLYFFGHETLRKWARNVGKVKKDFNEAVDEPEVEEPKVKKTAKKATKKSAKKTTKKVGRPKKK